MSTAQAGPLSMSLPTSTAKTAIPLIAEGTIAPFALAKIEQVITEKGPVIKFEWDLKAEVPNSDGGTLKPGEMGSKVFDSVYLYDKNTPAGQVPAQSMSKVCARLDALLGTGDPGNTKDKPLRPDLTPELIPNLIGKQIVATVKIRSNEGYTNNEFSRIQYPGDVAA